jgi:ComF family protein
MSNWSQAVLNRCTHVVQAIVPAHCVLCGASTSAARVCDGCAATLPRIPVERCERCASPLPAGSTCGQCLERSPHYDAVSAAYAYDFPVDALIQAYKYGGDLTLAPLLAKALADTLSDPAQTIIPMPLSPQRQRERGFNQAQELARHLGRRLGVTVLPSACRKVADTPPQAGLSLAARARNVRGAFVCDADLSGQCVAVVDDVMTTGATLNELARVLKRAGATRVSGWVVARTAGSRRQDSVAGSAAPEP